MKDHSELPAEIGAKFRTFLREVNGRFEVADKEGLLKFVAEYGEKYPALLEVFSINEDAVIEHFKRTGEVPPGIRITHTTTQEGDNVTKLEIFRDPVSPKS